MDERIEIDRSGMGTVVRLIRDNRLVASMAAIERGGAPDEDLFWSLFGRYEEVLRMCARLAEALDKHTAKIGCVCRWDEDGTPEGEHTSICFSNPSEVRQLLDDWKAMRS